MIDELILILGMAAVTFVVRYPVLVLVGKIPMPDPVFRALRYVPPAVLAAIIAPAVLLGEDGSLALTPDNSYLVATLAAGLVAWRTKNLLLTIVIGMAVLLGWRALLGM